MNTENEKYTELISRVKHSQPILSEPQRLTSTVMQRIELLPKKKTKQRHCGIPHHVRNDGNSSQRHCGLDPQSPENNAFNKEMLKQVTHDGGAFKKSYNKILPIVSLTSSIAASFLIGFFVFEQFLFMENNEYENSTPILPITAKNVSIEKPASLSEFNNLIRAKKEQQIFYSNIINHYKTF